MELTDENTLNLNGSHKIIHEGNKIILKGRSATLLTIVKSGDRYVFFSSESYGSWIEKLPDKIVICDRGVMTEYAYEVEAPAAMEPQKTEEKQTATERPAGKRKPGREKIEKRAYNKAKRGH